MKWYQKWASGVDYFFNKMIPKKFTVYVISTIIVFAKLNPPAEYWYVTGIYMGANALKAFADRKKELGK